MPTAQGLSRPFRGTAANVTALLETADSNLMPGNDFHVCFYFLLLFVHSAGN